MSYVRRKTYKIGEVPRRLRTRLVIDVVHAEDVDLADLWKTLTVTHVSLWGEFGPAGIVTLVEKQEGEPL